MLDGSLETLTSFCAGIRYGHSTSTPDPHQRFGSPISLHDQLVTSRFAGIGTAAPYLTQTVEQNPIIVQQKVTAWFSSLKYNRQITAAGISAAVSVLCSAIFVFLLNLSPRSPISSLNLALSWMFSWNFLAIPGIFGVFYFGLAIFLIVYIFSVDYDTYRNLRRLENAVILGVWTAAHLVLAFLINHFNLTPFWPSSASLSLLILVSCSISAYKVAFGADFRLDFPVEHYTKKKFIRDLLNFSKDSTIKLILWRSMHIFKWALFVTLNMACLLSNFHPSFWNLASPSALFITFSFVFFQQVMAHVIISLVKLHMMEPIKLVLPSPYFASESFLNNQPNLIHALTQEDPLFKIFGFRTLRDMTIQEPQERADVFTLSQPGGHPRNWRTIRDVCLSIIRQVSSKLEAENVSMQAINMKFVDKVYRMEQANRVTLLPPSLRPTHMDAPGIPKTKSLSPFATLLKPYVDMIQSRYFMDPPVISPYESSMVQYAIECLYRIAIHAYTEDSYGVVQPDLSKIIISFLDFELNIETFLRAKQLNIPDKRSVATIREMERVITEALCTLYNQYHGHIEALNLNAGQLELWELLVRPKRSCEEQSMPL